MPAPRDSEFDARLRAASRARAEQERTEEQWQANVARSADAPDMLIKLGNYGMRIEPVEPPEDGRQTLIVTTANGFRFDFAVSEEVADGLSVILRENLERTWRRREELAENDPPELAVVTSQDAPEEPGS